MTQEYESVIKLGDIYLDPRSGIEGVAVALWFHQSRCIDAYLEYMLNGEIKNKAFPEQRLVDPSTGNPPIEKQLYYSDVVLGRKYRDTQTGVEGHAAVMEFWEHMSNRVSIRHAVNKGKKTEKVIYHSIDDHLLEDVESKKRARELQPEKRLACARAA